MPCDLLHLDSSDDAALLLSASVAPQLGRLAAALDAGLDFTNFTAYGDRHDEGWESGPVPSLRDSMRSVDYLRDFMRTRYNHQEHRVAFEYLLERMSAADGLNSPRQAIHLLTVLLIGNDNEEARSVLKPPLVEHIRKWAQWATPADLGPSQNIGDSYHTARNEIALLRDELYHNFTHEGHDYRFAECLFAVAEADGGKKFTRRSYDPKTEQRLETVIDCGPAAFAESLLQSHYISRDAVRRYLDLRSESQRPREPADSPVLIESKTLEALVTERQEAFAAGLIAFLHSPEGARLPRSLISADDLESKSFDHILGAARLVEQIRRLQWSIADRTWKGANNELVTGLFEGRLAALVLDQESTRTKWAVKHAMRMLGIEVDELSGAGSSRGKGESVASELFTFESYGVDVHFERSKGIEQYAEKRLSQSHTGSPLLISLGGNLHHPTQTCSDVMTLMELFRCESRTIAELIDRTSKNPPCIAFYSRVDQKRADRALLDFVQQNLGWRTLLIVPGVEDIPRTACRVDEIVVHRNRHDQVGLRRILRKNNVAVTYMSNAEATAATDIKGSGQGRGEPATAMLLETIMDSGTFLMHPLPDSGEIEPVIYGHPRFLGARQITNKVHFIAAVTAYMLAARLGERREP